MLWIKRNLFFVLSMLVGLGLTGWAGFDFYSIAAKNSAVAGDLQTNRDQLKNLKSKTPPPTSENIQAAKEEAKRVEEILSQFRTAFPPFPVPPVTDEKGFKTILETTIFQLRAEASNADVTLPHDFKFSFSAQMEKLSYTGDGIQLWLVQLDEIKAICEILFHARVTALDSLQRVAVSEDDGGAADYLPGASNFTNQMGVSTPYKVTFRGYSEQLAAVLDGFARSKHLWIVKDVDARPSAAALPVIIPKEELAPQRPPPPMFNPRQMDPRMDPRARLGGGEGGGGRMRGGVIPERFRQAPPPEMMAMAPPPPAVPITVLSPKILFITLSVDLVKLKQPEVKTNSTPTNAAAKPASGGRPSRAPRGAP